MWYVRAEIIGEFVIKESFTDCEKAMMYCNRLEAQGIYDDVDIWFAGKE